MPNRLLTLDEVVERATPVMLAWWEEVQADLAAHPLPYGGSRLYANPLARDLMPIQVWDESPCGDEEIP
jgi:hypothetical protein